MSKTEVSGKQIKDGTIEQVDLSATLSGDITQLKSDVATLQTDVAGKASSAGLAAVATSGAYSDLSGKPSLAAVATSGSYNDLADKPSIPSISGLASETYVDTAVAGKADSASLAPVATSGAYADLTGKPSLFDGAYSSLTGAPSLATVATTGSYNDLADKPSIPSISGLATETYVDTAVAGKADSSSLATVATSGSYNDLTNKPSIPSITGLASETYVDTKVADLVASAPATLDTLNELAAALGDDASFSTTVTNAIAAKANSADLATVATSGAYADLTGKPSLFDGAYSSLTGAPSLATVATSGSYNDLADKPTFSSNLDGLTDVTITSASNGQVLQYNGTAWVNGAAPSSFSGSYTDLTNKPTIPSALDDLSDVAITSASKGQFVVHNGTSFVNSNTIEASGAAVKPLIVKAAASQTANLLEFQDSSGTALATFSSGAVLQLKHLYPTGAYGSTQNVCVGVNAGNAIFATEVVAIGQNAMQYNVSGQNVAIGHSALKGVSGSSASDMNTCVGAYSGASITSGPHNTLIGYYAGSNITTGAGNIIIGRHAPGNTNAANGSSYNVAIGYGTTVTGNNAVNISGGSTATGGINIKGTSCGTNAISLGTSAAAANDCLDIRFGSAQRIVGDASGLIGINEATPGAQLHITSGAAARKGLLIKGAASQTALLFEVQNSAGTSVVSFTNAGAASFSSNITTTGAINFGPTGILTLTSNGNYNGVALGRSAFTGESGLALGSYTTAGTNSMHIAWGGGGTGRWFQGLSSGEVGIGVSSPGAQLHLQSKTASMKGLIVQGAASQTANMLEFQNSSGTALTVVQSDGTLHAKRYTETVANAFNTSLAPSSGTLTIDTSTGNAVLGALNAAVTTWAFTNVPTENSKVTTITAVIAGNASYTYGDACSVNGSAITDGVMWSGGTAPTSTAGTDIITFIIVKDSAGTVKVFGSATTNFS